MEVYQCLHDLITKIEKKSQIIITARLYYGSLAVIDLHKLKYNSLLAGAEVFKMLFGISDSNPFGDYAMEVDEDNNITILRELGISQRDWTLFNIFLNTGTVPHYEAYLVDKTYLPLLISNLTILQEVCAKLGGIPSFDLFYENFYNKPTTVNKDFVEPLTAEEDKGGQYQWIVCRSNCQNEINNFLSRNKVVDDGWALGSIDLTGDIAVYYYYRKWSDKIEV